MGPLRTRAGQRVRPLVGLAILAIAWLLLVPETSVLLPPLAEVLRAFVNLVVEGLLLQDTRASLWRVLAGVSVGAIVSVILGAISTSWPFFGDYLSGGVEMVRPIPPIAWTPLAIMTFGTGSGPAIAIVALGSFFPIWLGIQQGLGEVRRSHVLAARSLGARWTILLTDVIVPSVLPFAVHGLRLGVGLGWFCVVAAEMMGASSGLGYGVQLFSLNIEMPRLYAYLIVIGLMGYVSNALLQVVDERLSHWRSDA